MEEIAKGDLNLARLWGHAQVDDLTIGNNSLICEDDPMESLVRFHVLRESLFDFNPITIEYLSSYNVRMEIAYGMKKIAEEAATYQVLGYFERLLELSGASNVRHRFLSKMWEGASSTFLALDWGDVDVGKKVKGTIFVDYVRMMNKMTERDWRKYLKPEDIRFMHMQIMDSRWYPFATFERMGEAIVNEIAKGDLDIIRKWGQSTVDSLAKTHRFLVEYKSPMDSLMRFQVLRKGFFDFDPININSISANYAKIEIKYGMSDQTEEAATYQSLGYFERLLELSGARNVKNKFSGKKWQGDPVTVLELKWE